MFYSLHLKKKQTQSKTIKKSTNEKDNKDLDAPEYLTNNARLSFGLNITKKSTNNPKEKRESILAKIKDFKNSQKKEQLSDNEDNKILSNEKPEPEPEKSLKEQALEELLKGLLWWRLNSVNHYKQVLIIIIFFRTRKRRDYWWIRWGANN